MTFLYENTGLNREQRRKGLKENRKLIKELEKEKQAKLNLVDRIKDKKINKGKLLPVLAEGECASKKVKIEKRIMKEKSKVISSKKALLKVSNIPYVREN